MQCVMKCVHLCPSFCWCSLCLRMSTGFIKIVTHRCNNWFHSRATLLMKINALPLSQTIYFHHKRVTIIMRCHDTSTHICVIWTPSWMLFHLTVVIVHNWRYVWHELNAVLVAVVWQMARKWDCCENLETSWVHTPNVAWFQRRIPKTEVLFHRLMYFVSS